MHWILPRGDETVQERVPIPGVYIVKSAEVDGISNYKRTPLHLHLNMGTTSSRDVKSVNFCNRIFDI